MARKMARPRGRKSAQERRAQDRKPARERKEQERMPLRERNSADRRERGEGSNVALGRDNTAEGDNRSVRQHDQ